MVPATRFRLGPLALALLLVAGCTPATVSTTITLGANTTTTTAAEVVDLVSVVYEVVALATHPNGAQLRVERIEQFDESVVVSGAITNGSPYSLVIGRGANELLADGGQVSAMVDPFPATELAPAGELDFSLRFAALPDTSAVTLRFNQGSGASPANPTSTMPSFEVGPIRLDPTATRPALPDPVPVSRVVSDSVGWGIELRVEGVNLTDNRIGVWVRISNPLGGEARISPTIAPSFIEDDLGNRYPLLLPADEGWISVPEASARSGALTFAGRIHPEATRLNVGLNAGTRVHQEQGRYYPEFLVREIHLEGDSALAPLPGPVTVGQSVTHPAGVTIGVHDMSFTELGVEVAMTLVNARADSVSLAATGTSMVDDLGNLYPLVPLTDNPNLLVEAGTTVEATLIFSGRVAGEVASISVEVNPTRSATDADTRQPAFTFGPFDLSRPDRPPVPVEARVFAVPERSRLVEDELAVSQVDRITQALTRFDATTVEGGIQLTLPDSILFDFGSSALRPDARQALALVAEILEYFEGDRVLVVGHTDSIGNPATNQRLSEQRARTVLAALAEEHGIDAGRLDAEGRGASEPVAPNTTADGADNPEGRQLNRRVELVVFTDRALPGS